MAVAVKAMEALLLLVLVLLLKRWLLLLRLLLSLNVSELEGGVV